MISTLVFLAVTLQAPTSARAEQAGWIQVKLKGTPTEIGLAHGRLLSKEIEDAVDSVQRSLVTRGKDWNWYRGNARRLFWKDLDADLKQEITGIANGASEKGANVDVDDILALNGYIELSDGYLDWENAHGSLASMLGNTREACSAFVATGSATANHKPVMGHNFWWDYITGSRWRVLFDITPATGNRVFFDALPGLVHSGSDFAFNSKGIMLCETTISGFVGYDPAGIPEFVRMRKAIQYSDTLDEVARIFSKGNNGGYPNTWLMANAKTGEIGKLELGLKNVIFHRSTEGAYFGANFPEDPKLTREEAFRYQSNPENVCELRKGRWKEFLNKNNGRISSDVAKQFVSDTYNNKTGRFDGNGGAFCSMSPYGGAVNGFVATADDVLAFRCWAISGSPSGRDIRFLDGAKEAKMPANPWVRAPF